MEGLLARVQEIAVGVMTNMVCHQSVFLSLVEKDTYLEKLLKLLDTKDSPTLVLVFRWGAGGRTYPSFISISISRCLHSYGYNLFTLLTSETCGPLPR